MLETQEAVCGQTQSFDTGTRIVNNLISIKGALGLLYRLQRFLAIWVHHMTPVMNNTKWTELRIGMHNLGELKPRFRVRNLRSGAISAWDREWFYHFLGDHQEDEWVEVEVTSLAQHDAVLRLLRAIRVPGVTTEHGFKICGYVVTGTQIDYL